MWNICCFGMFMAARSLSGLLSDFLDIAGSKYDNVIARVSYGERAVEVRIGDLRRLRG